MIEGGTECKYEPVEIPLKTICEMAEKLKKNYCYGEGEDR